MAVSVESISTLERRLVGNVPNQDIAVECEKQLKDLKGKAKLPGFRPGKVSDKVVKEKFGAEVRERVIFDLVQKDLAKAFDEVKLEPVGRPNLELTDTAVDKPEITYQVTFEVAPDVDLALLAKVSVEQPVCEITDADVDKVIDNLRKQQSAWKEVDRTAKDGDQATIDFKGTVDDVAFEGGTAEDFQFVLGTNAMLPDFEEGVTGSKAGDEKIVTVNFPENYGGPDLAGKEAKFELKIKKVEEPVLPELTDELVEKLGVKEGGVDALRKQVRERLELEVENITRKQAFEHLHDAMVKAFDMELPKSMLSEQEHHLRHELEHQLEQQGGGKGLLDQSVFADSIKERAQRQVKVLLVTRAFIKAEELDVTDDMLRAKLEKLAAGYEDPEQVVKWYYSQQELMDKLKNQVFEEHTYSHMLTKVKVKDKSYTYDDLLNPPQPAEKVEA